MSYLDRLKDQFPENCPTEALTKPTEAPFVSSVSTRVGQKEASDARSQQDPDRDLPGVSGELIPSVHLPPDAEIKAGLRASLARIQAEEHNAGMASIARVQAMFEALAPPDLPGLSPELAARLSPEDLEDLKAGDLSLQTLRAFEQLPQIIPPAGELARYDPAVGAKQILALEALESAAKRAKDADALKLAITAKLEAQRDFAADFRGSYVQGKHTDSYDRSVVRADAHCRHFGFHIRTVQRWAERLLDPAAFTAEYRERMAKVWRLIEMEQAANFSSDSVEWYTPARYIEAAREVLGGIDLDPASSAQANETVKATEFFTQEQDGLARDWRDRVWLNPPYGKSQDHGSLAGAFCDKAISEYERGNLDACIILVNSVHSQKWQAPLFDYVVCLVDHRIQFVSADGEENKSPTFMNMFVYLGPDPERFDRVFHAFGYVIQPFVGPHTTHDARAP